MNGTTSAQRLDEAAEALRRAASALRQGYKRGYLCKIHQAAAEAEILCAEALIHQARKDG